MNAAIINSRNEVIYSADVAEGIREIEVAGAITADGYPVNRKTYRVSRSKKNLAKASDSWKVDTISRRQHGDLVFYI